MNIKKVYQWLLVALIIPVILIITSGGFTNENIIKAVKITTIGFALLAGTYIGAALILTAIGYFLGLFHQKSAIKH